MIGSILAILGLVLMIVGGLWLLVKAFQQSILWGLGSLFIGPVLLVFAIMHWEACKKPFLIWLGGLVVAILGSVLGGASAIPMPEAG